MDFKKGKGNLPGDSDKSSSYGSTRSSSGRKKGDGTIDASPDNTAASRTGSKPGLGSGARNVLETKAWQESKAGALRIWHNYKLMLITKFKQLPRAEQETLITRICQVVTMGSAVLVIQLFYSFLPLFLRVLALPLALVGAWWAGTRVVAPMMIIRYDEHLNREY